MSETFYYTDLLDIMAAPYNGQPVPAAYGDQVRENLMALWRRETFCVTSSTGTILGNILVTFDTSVWMTPNCRFYEVPAGQTAPWGGVNIPPGVWLIGFQGQLSGTSPAFGFISAPGGTGLFLAIEQVTTSTIAALYYSTAVFDYVGVAGDGVGTLTASIAGGRPPTLWGVQLSDV